MTATRWLKELYDAHSSTLYRLAVNRLLNFGGSVADAQDVLQDVFRLALEKDIRSHPNPVGWLIKATENTCKNYARKHSAEAMRYVSASCYPDGDVHDIQIPVASYESEADILMTIECCLSEEEQRIIKAYCVENRSIDEIAHSLHITPNALSVRIFRIRKRLRKFLSNHV